MSGFLKLSGCLLCFVNIICRLAPFLCFLYVRHIYILFGLNFMVSPQKKRAINMKEHRKIPVSNSGIPLPKCLLGQNAQLHSTVFSLKHLISACWVHIPDAKCKWSWQGHYQWQPSGLPAGLVWNNMPNWTVKLSVNYVAFIGSLLMAGNNRETLVSLCKHCDLKVRYKCIDPRYVSYELWELLISSDIGHFEQYRNGTYSTRPDKIN